MTILFAILGFLVGLVVSHHYIVVPQWDTESELRKELKKVRGELYVEKHGRPVDQLGSILRAIDAFSVVGLGQSGQLTPESKVPHRAHSPVLHIDSIDDLIQGTKP